MLQKLPRSPQLLTLGSSRAQRVEPSFLQTLTGRRGFNAAVMGGTATDAWVTTRFAADRFPRGSFRYLWLVDARLASNGVHPDLAADPRARRYLDGLPQTTSACRVTSRYHADGSIAYTETTTAAQRAQAVARSVAKLVAAIDGGALGAGTLNPDRYTDFERTIEFMNRRGARPVIVLNPIYPRVLAALRRNGFPGHRASEAYLSDLHRRLDFVVVDCEDIRTWGGSPAHFVNATHVDAVNMRRLLRYVVAHSSGALR